MRRRALAPIAALVLLALVALPAIALAAGQLVTLNGSLPVGWDPPKWGKDADPYRKGLSSRYERQVDGITVLGGGVCRTL